MLNTRGLNLTEEQRRVLEKIDEEWKEEAKELDKKTPGKKDVLDGGGGPFNDLSKKYLKKVQDAIKKYNIKC